VAAPAGRSARPAGRSLRGPGGRRDVAARDRLGVDLVLVPSIGLTTGGFYKQFPSKDALIAEATQAAFGDLELLLTGFDSAHGDHDTARGALVDFYLSVDHRDQPGTGCPTAGFAGDMAREPTEGARATYAAGVEKFAEWLAADGDDGLPVVASLVGAILLARATAGTELSERILASTHDALAAPRGEVVAQSGSILDTMPGTAAMSGTSRKSGRR